MTITGNLRVSAYLGSASLERQIWRQVRLWLAVLILASTVIAGSAGLTDRLLDYVAGKYGQEAKHRLLEWQELIKSRQKSDEQEKLKLVNSFFNRLPFVADSVHWGKEDYWATPVEFLASNGGDCEDFAIAKYYTLKEMGVPEERLLITYVKSLKLNQPHMVLAYYPSQDADPLVLDNLVNDIKHASERDDLVPVYSFNGKDLWLAKERGRGKRIGSSDRISLWMDLSERIEKENNR